MAKVDPIDLRGLKTYSIARRRNLVSLRDFGTLADGRKAADFINSLPSIYAGRDLRALGHLKLAAIGPSTADTLANYRLKADLVPTTYRSEALASSLSEHAQGKRLLLARADRGRAILKEELERIAQVEQIAVYSNSDAAAIPAEVLDRMIEGSIDWVTLTSPAIAERLYELLPETARERVGQTMQLVSLSPVTTAAAKRLGWEVMVEAHEATWQGLVRALVDHVAKTRRETKTS